MNRFGTVLYWRSGIFGVLLGFAELSFTHNLHSFEHKKQLLADEAEQYYTKTSQNLKEKA